MKTLALLVFLTTNAHVKAEPESPRMRVIWDAAEQRMANQTDIWFEQGEFPRCIQVLRVVYALNPLDNESATNLAWMLENVERKHEALAVYVQLRQSKPADPDAPYPEAFFYYQRKAYSKVPPLLEPTLKMKLKPHANNYRTLAQAYERLGLLADAKRVYELLLHLLPGDGATLRNLERVNRKIKGETTGAPPPR